MACQAESLSLSRLPSRLIRLMMIISDNDYIAVMTRT